MATIFISGMLRKVEFFSFWSSKSLHTVYGKIIEQIFGLTENIIHI